MMDVIKAWVMLWARKKSYKAAVKHADEMRAKTFKKMHVIFNKGEFIAVSRQRLKQLHKEGAFKKGIGLKQLEKMIYYTTD